MRILVTGSRSWEDRTAIARAIMRVIADTQPMLLDKNGNPDRRDLTNVRVVHGDCPQGADALAQDVCEHMGISTERFPAEWGRLKRRAGLSRNIQMVETEPDICLAFIHTCRNPRCPIEEPHGSHGATHCSEFAEIYGVPVVRFGWKKDE